MTRRSGIRVAVTVAALAWAGIAGAQFDVNEPVPPASQVTPEPAAVPAVQLWWRVAALAGILAVWRHSLESWRSSVAGPLLRDGFRPHRGKRAGEPKRI